MGRAADVRRLAGLVGDPLRVEEVAGGWPALAQVEVEGTRVPVALFVAPVTKSFRKRDGVERRFQNPAAASTQPKSEKGRPLIVPEGRTPLLLGLWDRDSLVDVGHPVVVSADPWRREGRTTRVSVFTSLASQQSGAESGWLVSANSTGEPLTYFDPKLLPIVVSAARGGIDVPGPEVEIAVAAAGLVEARDDQREADAAAERARRAGTAIVRDRKFSKDVIDAYGGQCAMCGLALGLVQGAHIYPAAAPGSPDTTWNGLCLCNNHHAAFDRYLIWVDPGTRQIRLSPLVLEQAKTNEAVAQFVESTYATLVDPAVRSSRPRKAMLEQRNERFATSYEWA